MSDVNIETVDGTLVKTLYTTVEKGTLEDETKYEKRQATAPRTLTEAVTDNDGNRLSDVLDGMQIQLDKVTIDIKTGVNDVIDERAETDLALKSEIYSFNHNCLYRGKYLGDSVTEEQYAEIKSGTFNDLYIGDYWTIAGVNYRIAAFDYYLNCGDTNCTTHHAVIVPDTCLYTRVMNDTNTTTGGYVGSKMYTEGLESAKTTIKSAFSGHVLSHRIYLTNAVANGRPSASAWCDSEVELMCEEMVYGTGIFRPTSDGTNIPSNYRVEKSQLPLFAHEPSRICNRVAWWLRDVVSDSGFAFANSRGTAHCHGASDSSGVRPAFCIS